MTGFTTAASSNSAVVVSTDKKAKYDRQLRLWKDHGQQALERAKICLLGSTATGTEILKNLILPGIGSFTVVDNAVVTADNCKQNFFLNAATSVGRCRAECATDLLRELNSDVAGTFVEEDVGTLISSNPQFFCSFQLIIVACEWISEKSLLQLGSICQSQCIPLVICRSYGMIGYLRIYDVEHQVVETHPDNVFDLRLDCAWPELLVYTDTFDFSIMNSMELSHTPYIILLLKARQMWLDSNRGEAPSSSQERESFKSLLRSLGGSQQRNKESSITIGDDEENFNEACSQAFRTFQRTTVPSSIRRLFEDESCKQVNAQSSEFWLLVHALWRFVESEDGQGRLPLIGRLPDMKSDTERYVCLQQIYQEKAAKDRRGFSARLRKVLEDTGSSLNISDEKVEIFCKNCHFLRVIRYRTIEEEYHGSPRHSLIQQALGEDQTKENNLIWYVLLRAADQFHEQRKRFPGSADAEVEGDIGVLKKIINSLLSSWSVNASLPDDYVHEITRAGAGEIHSIAALMGGVASQECLKLLTKQYVPLENTWIFNGYHSTSSVFDL